jgi:DedD protein
VTQLSTDPARKEEIDRPSNKTEEIHREASIPAAPKTGTEMKTKDPVERVVEAPAVTTQQPLVETQQPGVGTSEKLSEAVVARSSVETFDVSLRSDSKQNIEPRSIASETATPVRQATPATELPVLTEKAPEAVTPEWTKSGTGVVKSAERLRPLEVRPPTPLAPLSTPKLDAQPQQATSPVLSATTTLEEKNTEVGAPTPASVQIAKAAEEGKTAPAKIAEKLTPPAAAAKLSVVETMKSGPASDVTKFETPASAARIESTPAIAKLAEMKNSSPRAASEPAGKPKTDSTRSREAGQPHVDAATLGISTQPPTVTAASPRETVKATAAGEQIALLKKPAEVIPEKKPLARTVPKPLEGFIIQLGFNDREKAQRWAETMERRGYAVSITEAGAEGALRVRLGNFAIRDDAERQLQTFKQQGLSGIIINLPQGFRPEARSSIP